MAKSKMVVVSGVLTECRFIEAKEPVFGRILEKDYNVEHYSFFLNCVLETDEGEFVHFRTPKSPMVRTTQPGSISVVFVDSEYRERLGRAVFPADHSWFRLVGEKSVTAPGLLPDIHLEPKVQVGDRIEIHGRLKSEEVGSDGKYFRVLNYVKRILS